MSRVAGLVLAAGAGSRLGEPKATVVIAGERMVDRAVRVLREGGCLPVYVVTGAVDVTVDGATTVANPDWPTGMASSLRAGLTALGREDDVDVVVVALVDQPGVGAPVVRRLVAAFAGPATVAVATYAGSARNPVLLGRDHWTEAASLATGDVGARPFLRANADVVIAVECGDIGDPADIDTPDDLASL